MASIMDDLRSFRRSWVHQTAMQMATLTVTAATFAVVGFIFLAAMNLNRLIVSWGEGVEISLYLKDEIPPDRIDALKSFLESRGDLANVRFIAHETATENFKTQMASYAPGLLSDPDFANPFPASFRVALRGGVKTDADVKKLEAVADELRHKDGIDDVSFGQSWIKNYSEFVSALVASGGTLVIVLILGSLFVIGNSIRMSIAGRRDEIEILELVGATSSMIRRPFVMEGALTGLIASIFSLALNFTVFAWQLSKLNSSLVFARLASQFSFLGVMQVGGFIVGGMALGAFGAWLAVRSINDGWAASGGAKS